MPDPHQVDISLSLLPGESEAVISDLINTMRTAVAQLAAISGGNEYAAMAGPVARVGITASTAVRGERAEVGANASHPPGHEPTPEPELWLPPDLAEERSRERTRAKLAAAANIENGPTAEIDNASMPPEAAPSWQTDPTEELPIVEQTNRNWRRWAIDRAKDTIIARKPPTEAQQRLNEPGDIDVGSTVGGIRDWAMTYGVYRNAHGGVHDEVERLKAALRPETIENLGTELGGTQAPTMNLGETADRLLPGRQEGTSAISEITGVLPGMPLIQAIRGALGNNEARESAGYRGARAELKAMWEGIRDPYLTQSESRQLTHGAIGEGWSEELAEERRGRFSRLREGTRGLSRFDSRIYDQMEDQVLRGGGSSMREFTQALKAIPEAAEAAHMGLNEYAQSAVQYAESLTNSGASFGRAMMAAPSWTAATGTAPQVAEAVRQSPIVQGHLYSQGYTQATQGLATSGTVAQATSSSIRELYDIYEGGFRDITKQTDAGTLTTTADEQIRAQIGADLGINADMVERLMAQEERIGKAATATEYIDQYERTAGDLEKNLTGPAQTEARRWMRTGEGAPDEAIVRPEVLSQLREAGLSEREVAAVNQNKSATDFASAARDALSKQTAELTDDTVEDDESINQRIAVSVDVKMKGPAAAMFENIRKDVDVSRNARRKARRPGSGSYTSNNPDQTPPKGSWIVEGIRSLGGD